MSTNDLDPADIDQRCRMLTDEIRNQAASAQAQGPRAMKTKHALACGQALAQLKDLLRHGDWNRCLQEQCALTRSTANRYMRLASHSDRLARYMTIREAYIAAGVIHPKPTPIQPPEQVDPGFSTSPPAPPTPGF